MSWTEPNHQAWRKKCSRISAVKITQEVIKNLLDACDEGVPDQTRLDIDVSYARGSGVSLSFEVSGPASLAFEDGSKPWTLFASGLEDDHKLRGRLGRCLKQLLGVMDIMEVSTSDKALRWTWDGQKKVREPGKGTRKKGIFVSGTAGLWDSKDYAAIRGFVSGIQSRETSIYLNGKHVPPSEEALRTYKMSLPTVTFDEEGQSWMPSRKCHVEVFHSGYADRATLYEMGIPVDLIKGPWSLNVRQRVPLDKKGKPKGFYVRNLRAGVLDRMIEEELR